MTKIEVARIVFAPKMKRPEEFLVYPEPDGNPSYAVLRETEVYVEIGNLKYHENRTWFSLMSWLKEAKNPMADIELHPDRFEHVVSIRFYDGDSP